MWLMWIVITIMNIATPSVVTETKSNSWNVSGTNKDEAQVQHGIRRMLRSTTCILPAYPDHGTYSDVLNGNSSIPGQSRHSFILSVSCQPGYGSEDPNTSYGDRTMVLCVQGVWYQAMPKCVRFCKLDPDPSVHYMCHKPDIGLKSCNGYLAPGTVISPVCNSPNYYSTDITLNMECIFGFWNYIAKCKAECGRMSAVGGFSLIIDGENARPGLVPWHVGLYRKTSTPYKQICGGSIVSTNVVISAAHCVSNSSNKPLPASGFAVAGGKIYRPWDERIDVNAQKTDVQEIKVPRLFQGADANFGEDIAVLILETPFVYNSFVRPVCLNFDVFFNNWQLRHGKLGKVAGWGLMSANGTTSSVLQIVDLPFIDEDTCINTVPPSFRPYITGDKFCAGYTNGTAMCKGDSGGGLSFPDIELGIERFYLRGVVSTAPTSESNICNDNTYVTFTKLLKHQEFIISAIARSERKTCRDADCTGQHRTDEDTCEWDGFKGKCVPAAKCITTVNKGGEKPPVCPEKDKNLNHICCTDCQPINDISHFAMVTGWWTHMLDAKKDGRKARNACYHYVRDLPHACYQLSFEVSREQNTISKCHTFNSWDDTANYTLWGSKHPYLVAFGFGDSLETARWWSTGTIISEKFILTSGNTTLDNKPVRYAAVGMKNYTWNRNWQTHQVKKIHLHPAYKEERERGGITRYNDIAVLELETPITFSPDVLPACLPEPDEELDNTARYYHWSEGKIVEFKQITPEQCNTEFVEIDRHLMPEMIKPESQLCYRSNGTCGGFLGAPLTVKSKSTPCMNAVIGISSWQLSCRTVVFTSVKHYTPWIESIVWP